MGPVRRDCSAPDSDNAATVERRTNFELSFVSPSPSYRKQPRGPQLRCSGLFLYVWVNVEFTFLWNCLFVADPIPFTCSNSPSSKAFFFQRKVLLVKKFEDRWPRQPIPHKQYSYQNMTIIILFQILFQFSLIESSAAFTCFTPNIFLLQKYYLKAVFPPSFAFVSINKFSCITHPSGPSSWHTTLTSTTKFPKTDVTTTDTSPIELFAYNSLKLPPAHKSFNDTGILK